MHLCTFAHTYNSNRMQFIEWHIACIHFGFDSMCFIWRWWFECIYFVFSRKRERIFQAFTNKSWINNNGFGATMAKSGNGLKTHNTQQCGPEVYLFYSIFCWMHVNNKQMLRSHRMLIARKLYYVYSCLVYIRCTMADDNRFFLLLCMPVS